MNKKASLSTLLALGIAVGALAQEPLEQRVEVSVQQKKHIKAPIKGQKVCDTYLESFNAHVQIFGFEQRDAQGYLVQSVRTMVVYQQDKTLEFVNIQYDKDDISLDKVTMYLNKGETRKPSFGSPQFNGFQEMYQEIILELNKTGYHIWMGEHVPDEFPWTRESSPDNDVPAMPLPQNIKQAENDI
jgi:hypothetical protein